MRGAPAAGARRPGTRCPGFATSFGGVWGHRGRRRWGRRRRLGGWTHTPQCFVYRLSNGKSPCILGNRTEAYRAPAEDSLVSKPGGDDRNAVEIVGNQRDHRARGRGGALFAMGGNFE